MATTLPAEFIRTKIRDCGQVMIYRYIDEQTRQAIAFRKDFIVEDSGQLHFTINNVFADKYTDKTFPVEFFFYKKGMPFYVTAKGIAVSLSPDESSANSLKDSSNKNLRVQMNSCELVTLKKQGMFHFGLNSVLSL